MATPGKIRDIQATVKTDDGARSSYRRGKFSLFCRGEDHDRLFGPACVL
jgi:hypothetical protein